MSPIDVVLKVIRRKVDGLVISACILTFVDVNPM